MPLVRESDSDLGLDAMLRIIPDTWNNISWVVVNSIDQIVKQAIEQRRREEQVRQYAIKANVDLTQSIEDSKDVAQIETGRVKKEVDDLEA
jgi:hypothetical protein